MNWSLSNSSADALSTGGLGGIPILFIAGEEIFAQNFRAITATKHYKSSGTEEGPQLWLYIPI